jgi:hypothetical protein
LGRNRGEVVVAAKLVCAQKKEAFGTPSEVNNMIQLVLIFCLTGSGTDCKAVHPPFAEPYGSMQACMLQAEQVAAQELSDRLDLQGYRLARWRCEPGSLSGTPT